jgi:branched-chain amino acid transport system permease protein
MSDPLIAPSASAAPMLARRLRGWLIAFAIVAVLPTFAGEFYVNLATQMLIAALFSSSLNLLVGYGGLTSLGHASYFGVAAFASAWLTTAQGWAHWMAAPAALLVAVVVAAAFGWIALRATGIGFLMITLALGQVLWGVAYRWVSVTGGDNGITGITRPSVFGIDLNGSTAFFYFTLIVVSLAVAVIAVFVSSPFGTALQGTRDQPRRMAALGYHVWMIRWLTFVFVGFLGAVAGLLFVYYNKYIHPTSLSLATSAEALLGVMTGGTGTLAGPIVGAAIVLLLKNYVSGFVERWNMLLGIVFVLIVVFMPEGVVPGFKRIALKLMGKAK